MIGLDGKPIEVQVRTHEMHRRAEYGIAAHWGYKEKPSRPERGGTAIGKGTKDAGATTKGRGDKSLLREAGTRPGWPEGGKGDPGRKGSSVTAAQRAELAERDRRAERLALAKETSSTTAEIEWMQRIVDFQNETTDPIEFLEALKLDLEEDEVYVFTPKGKVIALTANATPVDFAYTIHTEVGHRCIGGQGQRAPGAPRHPSQFGRHRGDHHLEGAHRRPLPRLVGNRGLVAGTDQDTPVVLP